MTRSSRRSASVQADPARSAASTQPEEVEILETGRASVAPESRPSSPQPLRPLIWLVVFLWVAAFLGLCFYEAIASLFPG